MENLILFDNYQAQSKAEWRSLVQQELRGGDFSSLYWQTASGITVQPYYTAEDLKDIAYPGHIYAKEASSEKWQNLEKIIVEDAKKANKLALAALNAGADGIIFDIPNAQVALNELLEDIFLEHCSIYFTGQDDVSAAFLRYCQDKNLDMQSLRGGMLAPGKPENTVSLLKEHPALPFKLIFIGAQGEESFEKDPVKALSATLLQIVNVLDELTDEGINAVTVFQHIVIELNISSSYYFEICKLRALRLLLAGIAQAYEAADFHPATIHIHCRTSPAQADDENQNMIRNTSQAMSAILGSCNSLYIAPHDHDVDSDFSRRIARNISLILKEEAYLDKVADPGAGSYFFESLTKEITERVWNQFIATQSNKP